MTLPDAKARARAATDYETNLVVLAGAGTGKTSLLVERVLNAVGSGRVRMEQIAAITFTEKAAGEMRERVASGLDRLRALAGDELESGTEEADRSYAWLVGETGLDPEQVASRALAAMQELDRTTVTTIHGFCAELLRSHPVEARVDPDFIVDSGEHFERLCAAAWEAYVTRELGADAQRAELWRRILSRVSTTRLGRLARAMAGFSIPSDLLRPPFGQATASELFGAVVERRLSEIDEFLGRREADMTPLALRCFQSLASAFRSFTADGLEAFKNELDSAGDMADRVEKGTMPKPNKKFDGADAVEFKRRLDSARRLARDLLRIDDSLTADVVRAVAPFAHDFREAYLRQGFVSFDGLLALARDLVRDAPGIRRALKRRFRMLLIDEFQDTDPLQYEIVLFLAEGEETAAQEAFAAALDPGRLFIVGDAKQSIYRFRGADYRAYRRAVDRVVQAGGETLDLVANFRSVPGVLGPVNALFEQPATYWNTSRYQPEYVAIDAVRTQDTAAPRVELWTVDVPEGAKAEERREAEGRLLAAQIERLVDEHGPETLGRITILFRAFTKITHYLRPLRERGIPFVVDGGRDFLKRPEVAELMATLRTLSQPADAPALLAFLRSPAGGVPDTELAAFAAGGGRWDWRSSVDPSFPLVGVAFERLRTLAETTRHVPADAAVRHVLRATRLLPLGAAAFEGAQRVANLRKLAAAAGDLARDGILSLEEVVEALAEGRLEDIHTDRPLADDAAQAVRITSIHRMKGLENDWVFLPDLARQEVHRQSETELVRVARLEDGRTALAVKAAGIPNSASAWLEAEDREQDHAEEVRVFYVALTRARERLAVLAGPARHGAPWVEALGAWGYDPHRVPEDGASLLGDQVLHRVPASEPRPLRPAPDLPPGVRRAVERYDEARVLLERAAVAPFRAPSGVDEEAFRRLRMSRADATPERGSRDLGQAVGLAAHRLLERWETVGETGWPEALDTICGIVADTEEVDELSLTTEVHAIIRAFLSSPLGRRFARLDVVGREVSLLMREDEHVTWRGSIDLLYRAEDGELVVADFKSDADPDPARMRERYAGQLRVYAEALGRAIGRATPPRAELWLLRTGDCVEVGSA